MRYASGESSNDVSLILIGKVLLAYYHHASTDHLQFRIAVIDTARYVRRHRVRIVESAAGYIALQFWYRLCTSHSPSKTAPLLADDENLSLSGEAPASPGVDEHLQLKCIVGMSSDDLIHDILVKTIDLRRSIVIYRCTATVHNVSESSPQLGLLAYQLISQMTNSPLTAAGRNDAISDFVRGDHLRALLGIQRQRLEVWRSKVAAEEISPKQYTNPAGVAPPHITQQQFGNHRRTMNELYYLLCRLIVAGITDTQCIGFGESNVRLVGRASPILHEAIDMINKVDLKTSNLLDIYTFSLTEVLLQLSYNYHSTAFFDYILDVIWPRLEASGRGFENSHLPTHIAKRIIALVSNEWHASRRILLSVLAIPEDTPKTDLFDVNRQFDVVLYGYSDQQGKLFVRKVQLP